MHTLLKILNDENLTCIVEQDGNIYKDTANGIRPILRLYEEQQLTNAIVADRVIGKAAAMLIVLGGARELHTMIISEHACTYLKKHNVSFTYERCVPYIINRNKDGMCPMEQTVLDCDDEQEAYHRLLQKLASLQQTTQR